MISGMYFLKECWILAQDIFLPEHLQVLSQRACTNGTQPVLLGNMLY
jgi:hypothetical protein